MRTEFNDDVDLIMVINLISISGIILATGKQANIQINLIEKMEEDVRFCHSSFRLKTGENIRFNGCYSSKIKTLFNYLGILYRETIINDNNDKLITIL